MRKAVWGVGVLVVIVWCLFAGQYVVLSALGHGWAPDKLGQWGDSFGALNALFGSLGFIGLLATLWMQGDQIEQQKSEGAVARDEQHRQRFESSFFQLLSLMREARDGIKYGSFRGEAAIQQMATILSRSVSVKGAICSIDDQILEIIKEYELSFGYSQNTVGRYCRVFHNILKKIDSDKMLPEAEKNDYARLLRSQLSDDEVSLLGVNGMYLGYLKYKSLVGRYRILKYSSNPHIRSSLEASYGLDAFSSYKH
ncbi:putative phage abortive infection protein [Kaistia defluvii]|uniref:Phage abortive infection protein n=1 Tax=Kaistia defluvii TaxID=410841 RepID=A0ABV2QW93_9HYPH